MEKEVDRIIKKMVEMKWITINKDLNPEVLSAMFIEMLKEIKLKDYLDIFTPKF